ncbi:MAG TPA: tetratricopeptide repeat protein, partial [Candidatus Limnocylindrales bacterium]
ARDEIRRTALATTRRRLDHDPRAAPAWLAIVSAVLLGSCGGSPVSQATNVDPPVAQASVPAAPASSGAPPFASAPPSPSPPPSSAGPATGSSGSPTEDRIVALEARLRRNPNDGEALRDLGALLLQRVRETADPSLYQRAEEAFDRARHEIPDDPYVLVGIGTLELARHEFAAALKTGRQALSMEAVLPEAEGVVVDALVELGRYDEAVEAAQRMIDLRPNLASFARVSYLRELHGDLSGALDAMESAISAGGGATENVAYVTVLAGNLLTYLGRRQDAGAAYRAALSTFPDFTPALAAQGRAAVAAGDFPTAIARFSRAAAIVPLPEYVIALGEAQEASGDMAAARRSYDLARAETRLFEASGVVVDLELGLFEADHGDPVVALELARDAYRERPTIKASDALAWALYRNGRLGEARDRLGESLRLGTRDPVLLYHAGMIEAAAGDRKHARAHLQAALDLDAGFSATGAAAARRTLLALGG